MLAAIWGAFIQGKHLHPSKNSKLCGILICSTPISPPLLCRSLENKQPTIMAKASGLAATRGTEYGWSSFKAPFSENSRYMSYLVIPWKSSLARLSLLTWLTDQPWQQPFPWEYLSKAFRGNCSTPRLPEAVDNSCTQWASQKLKRKS